MSHYRHYKHLHIPDNWEQYWSKYPNGYSVLEALINWTSQVNDMVDSQNRVSDQMTCLQIDYKALEKELRMTWDAHKENSIKSYAEFKAEIYTIINNWIGTIEPTIQNTVVTKLEDWLTDGTLASIISLDVFELKADKLEMDKIVTIVESTGLASDSEHINEAISNGGNFLFKKGIYNIDEDIQVKSNSILTFEKGAIFKKVPTAAENYYILNIADVDNTTLNNPQIVGDRPEHLASGGEWGHGINLVNSDKVVINDPDISECWGDGMYIGHEFWGTSTKRTGTIIVNDPIIDHARRNGISVCGGEKIIINNPIVSRIDGVLPKSGIDIEPEGMGGVLPFLTNLTITNPQTSYCGEAGIFLFLENLKDKGLETTIDILNHRDTGSQIGQWVGGLSGKVKGKITIQEPIYRKNKLAGYYQTSYKSIDTPLVSLKKPIIEDFNATNSTNAFYNAGIMIMKNTENPATGYNVGNIIITEPHITRDPTLGNQSKSICVFDFTLANEIENVEIINPLKVAPALGGYPVQFRAKNSILRDDYLTVENEASAYFEHGLGDSSFNYYHNKGSADAINYTFSDTFSDGSSVLFEVVEPFVMRIHVPENRNIYPNTGVLKNIQSYSVGSRLRLERKNGNWFITEMIGEWLFV